ncbi:MAG: C39 family peptidase [Flavobacteriales bacterium]|nr:C39 family peptidase [Flavobacteriales bacterium]
MTHSENQIKNKIISMLPALSDSELDFISKLPQKFILDVPFLEQDEKFWCGAAVVQMTQLFYGQKPKSQKEIVKEAHWEDWKKFDHSTFREKLGRYFLKQGMLFSQYYPAGHIAPKMKDGLVATDFIRKNVDFITPIDFNFFKALIVNRKAPIIVRLHFTQDDYDMPEELIQRMDMCGHCVLVVGYDENGFIVHDPWQKKKWGGNLGGAYTNISYERLNIELPTVDATLDFCGVPDLLKVHIPPIKEAVYQGKEISVNVILEWPGIEGILSDWYSIEELNVELVLNNKFSTKEDLIKKIDKKMIPGQSVEVKWLVNVGKEEGSFPIKANSKGTVHSPSIPWELHTEDIKAKIESSKNTRICVFSKEFLLRFGRVNEI